MRVYIISCLYYYIENTIGHVNYMAADLTYSILCIRNDYNLLICLLRIWSIFVNFLTCSLFLFKHTISRNLLYL